MIFKVRILFFNSLSELLSLSAQGQDHVTVSLTLITAHSFSLQQTTTAKDLYSDQTFSSYSVLCVSVLTSGQTGGGTRRLQTRMEGLQELRLGPR